MEQKQKEKVWVAHTAKGTVVTSYCWDWCGMNTLITGYIEDGMTEKQAEAKFWADVKDYDTSEYECIMEAYDKESDAIADGAFDELRIDYLENLSLDIKSALWFDGEPSSIEYINEIVYSVEWRYNVVDPNSDCTIITKHNVNDLPSNYKQFEVSQSSSRSGYGYEYTDTLDAAISKTMVPNDKITFIGIAPQEYMSYI